MCGEIALTRGAVQLPPGAAIGMAIGPQGVQPQPAAIVTIGVGTKVLRGVDGTGTAVRERHGIGPSRRCWRRLADLLCTQHAVRLMRQALARLRLSGTLALGLRYHGWGRQAWLGPSEMQ